MLGFGVGFGFGVGVGVGFEVNVVNVVNVFVVNVLLVNDFVGVELVGDVVVFVVVVVGGKPVVVGGKPVVVAVVAVVVGIGVGVGFRLGSEVFDGAGVLHLHGAFLAPSFILIIVSRIYSLTYHFGILNKYSKRSTLG